MGTREVVEEMVGAINNKNAERRANLMSPNVVFVGPRGKEITGRSEVLAAFDEYFKLFPDYRIVAEEWVVEGQKAMFRGRSRANLHRNGRRDPKGGWDVRAAWLAEIEGNELTRWQVFADTMEVRRLLGSNQLPRAIQVENG